MHGRYSSGRDKKNLVGRQVEQLVTSQPQIDGAALAKSSVVVQGLSAYEYILYDAKTDIADDANKARYCPLLVAIGERQKALAEEILASWNSTDGMLAQMTKFPNQRYADSPRSHRRPAARPGDCAWTALKKKLGTPMGRQSKGIPQPFQAEAWRSQSSLAKPGRQPGRRPDRMGRRRQQRPARPAAVGSETIGRQNRRRLRRVPETVRQQPAHPQRTAER